MLNTKHQDILHLMKCHTFTKLLVDVKKDAINNFPDKKDKYFPLLYETNPAIKYIRSQLKDFIDRVDYLDVYLPQLELLKKQYSVLGTFAYNTDVKIFKSNLDSIFEAIDKMYKYEVKKKVDKLTCQECIRLDEAITDFRNNCFLSTVILAVSAIEARLHYLIRSKNKRLYAQYFENRALGTLISLFDENKFTDKKFKKLKLILPEEHGPLMEVFNTYRIYCAHPKEKTISQKIAQSVLNLTFAFLLDERLRIKDKKLLKHA